jgi:hypothetical protein
MQDRASKRRVLFNGLHVRASLSLLAIATLTVGCTTEPTDQSLVGFWHVVDFNGSVPVPNPNFSQVLLELHPDSTWAQYYNDEPAPDQGVWTAHTGGKISLTGDFHGEGFVRDGKLTVEWGVLDVYHYRRGRE